LLLLADPVSVAILRRLADGPLETTELLDRVGFLSRSTYFERMRDLEDLALIARTRTGDVPPVVECRLTSSGERLLPVADFLEAWLEDAPCGPLKLGEAYATATVKALGVAWGSTLLRWLAERPHSLTELEQLVDVFGYRKLERIARDLAEAGLVERVAVGGRLNPYGVTDWARRAAGPLAAAMRWERREIPKRSASATSMEAEGALLLALPLVELRADADGTCVLLVDTDLPRARGLGGAIVRIIEGRPVAWAPASELETGLEADCSVRGATRAWLRTGAGASSSFLRRTGNIDLADEVIASLREVGTLRRDVPFGGSAKPPARLS
jgi:DNA-binding HxlR family transcriptional regulator